MPIVPLTRVWNTNNSTFSRTQRPLCLATVITIHTCQGWTLDQTVVDLGMREQSAGPAFVAVSRLRRLTDLVLQPFAFYHISRLGVAPSVLVHTLEEIYLRSLTHRGAP